MNSTADQQRSPVAFSLLMSPARKGWPTHGAFARVGASSESPPVFSVEMAEGVIKTLVEQQVITGDQAGELSHEVAASGLPLKKTRWDNVVQTFRDQAGLAQHLIGYFSGAREPQEGSGPARFEVCQEGHLCHSENCGHYPPHGRLFLANVVNNVDGLVFSAERARERAMEGSKKGLFSDDEVEQVLTDAGHAKIALEAGRFDALASAGLEPETLNAMLDIVVGLTPIETPVAFMPCGGHVHLGMVNNVAFSYRRLHTVGQATAAIDRDLKNGLIDDTDAERLRAQLATFGLPETAPEGDDEIPAELREMVDVIFAGQVPPELRNLIHGGRFEAMNFGG